MDLPESSELDHELCELRKWTSMLGEVQHTTAIVQMIRETSFVQVRILIEVLRQREAEFTAIYNAVPEYSPLSHGWIERKQSSSPISMSSSMTSTTTSSNTSISRSYTPLCYSLPQPSYQIVSPPSENPHPQPHLSPAHQSQSPKPLAQVLNLGGDIETQTSAQLRLVSLTTVPPHPTELRKKRRRKVPHYPRDESDSRWLLNWLHSLRLHKYAPKLQGLTPSELLELEDKEDVLIQRGIDSIGARKKMIVAFGEAKKQLAAEAEARKK